MSKITDLLLDTMSMPRPATGRASKRNVAILRRAHEALPRTAAGGPAARYRGQMDALVDEFERIVNGMAMLDDRPPRSVDEAVAVGERLSVLLVSEYLSATARLRPASTRPPWW